MWRPLRRLMRKPLTPQESAALAREMLAEGLKRPIAGIVTMRCKQYLGIMTTLEHGAYPTDAYQLAALSLWPFLLQEANYDDIDWQSRDPAQLRQLRPDFELDFLVQVAGRRWAD